MPFSLRSLAARVPRGIPAVFSFALLIAQAVIPWTSLNYATQDGPSHLYTAIVARDLLFNSDSPYSAVYRFQPKLVTNWSTTILMNAAELMFGARDAEHAVATLCVVLGFFGLAYLRRSLDPHASPWSPVLNFLLFNWFLWIGFYNFYLGMALVPFVSGFYIRHVRDLNRRRGALLALGFILLFFTHVLALAVALLCTGMIALWARSSRAVISFSVAAVPALILLFFFIKASGETTKYDPALAWAWSSFPMHAFASGQGRAGEQSLLYPAMLFVMAVGVLGMTRAEWTSSRGAIVTAAVICFGLYLLVPNAGFGGDEIKIRFAWTTFVLGCVVALTVSKLRSLEVPIAIYATCFLSASLVHAWKMNVVHASRAVAAYSAALEQMRPGSRFIRVRFPTDQIRKRLAFETIALEPLFHIDSRAAVRRKLVALSDYQASSGLFPVAFRSEIPAAKQYALWDLEGSGTTTEASLRDVLRDFPLKIDYVVLLGDGSPGERAREFESVKAYLDSTLSLAYTDESKVFARVYRR